MLDKLGEVRQGIEVSCGAPSCPSFPVHTLVHLPKIHLLDLEALVSQPPHNPSQSDTAAVSEGKVLR